VVDEKDPIILAAFLTGTSFAARMARQPHSKMIIQTVV
jgi:hypothetical protein